LDFHEYVRNYEQLAAVKLDISEVGYDFRENTSIIQNVSFEQMFPQQQFQAKTIDYEHKPQVNRKKGMATLLTSDGLLMSRNNLNYMQIASLSSKEFFNRHDYRNFQEPKEPKLEAGDQRREFFNAG